MNRLKTYLLAIAAICIFCSGLSAQGTYQNYYNSTYEWHETQTGAAFCYYYADSYTYWNYFHFTGIDSLDGYHWYKVHHDWQRQYGCNGQVIDPPGGTAGAAYRLREDSTGKIWVRNNNGQTRMAYDFRSGLGIGDTLWMEDYTDYIVVGSIDSLNFGSGKRARYWGTCSTSYYPVYVVEGIGSMKGLGVGASSLCYQIPDNFWSLNCAKINGTTLVLDNNYVCGTPGHVVVGLEDEIDSGIGFSWYPKSERVVLTNLPSLETQSWTVYDINGRILQKGDELNEEIHLSGLQSGMYIFVANGSGEESARAWRFLKH